MIPGLSLLAPLNIVISYHKFILWSAVAAVVMSPPRGETRQKKSPQESNPSIKYLQSLRDSTSLRVEMSVLCTKMLPRRSVCDFKPNIFYGPLWSMDPEVASSPYIVPRGERRACELYCHGDDDICRNGN